MSDGSELVSSRFVAGGAEAQRAVRAGNDGERAGPRAPKLAARAAPLAQHLAESLPRRRRAACREPALGRAQHAPAAGGDLDPRDLAARVGEEQRRGPLRGAALAPFEAGLERREALEAVVREQRARQGRALGAAAQRAEGEPSAQRAGAPVELGRARRSSLERNRDGEPLLVHAEERRREPRTRHLDRSEAALGPAPAHDPLAGERARDEGAGARDLAARGHGDLLLRARGDLALEALGQPRGRDPGGGGHPGEGLRLAREVPRELAPQGARAPAERPQAKPQARAATLAREAPAQHLGAGASLVATEIARRSLALDRAVHPRSRGSEIASTSFSDPVR